MRRLNSFQKDLLVLIGLFFVHTLLCVLSPLRSFGPIEQADISRRLLLVLSFEDVATGETVEYVPVLAIVYGLVLLYFLAKKARPLTLIYGLALVLLARVNFLSQLFQLRGTQEDFRIEGVFSPQAYVEGEAVAHDVSAFVLGVLLLIQLSIVGYQLIGRRLRARREGSQAAHESNQNNAAL